jgi:NitT/TauT family transport system substrate-binding protein
MNRLIKILVVLIITMMLFTGCAKYFMIEKGKLQNDNINKEKTVIRIGMMSSTDVIPYVLMNEKGIADKYNIDLQLEVFTSAKDRDAALQAGELDGVLTDYIGVSMYQNAGFDVRITGITDGDYILVAGKNTGIESMDDIKGKSIAISENTLIDYTLNLILIKNNMKYDDVVKEIVPRIPDRLELLRNDMINLGLLPEPFATLAIKGGAKPLGSANEFGLYPAVSAFTKKALDKKLEAIKNLYKAYNEAVEYINKTDITEYDEIVVKAVGYPEEMIGKLEYKEFRISNLPPKEDVETAIKWAAERGLCKETLTYEQMIYDVNK